MTVDLFESFGDSLIPKTVKAARAAEDRRAARQAARIAANPPMVKQGLEKKQEATSRQMIRYREYKRQVFEGLLHLKHGENIGKMRTYLRKLTFTPDELVRHTISAKWILECPLETRYVLLSYINRSLGRWYVRNGHPDPDDPIPSFDGTPDPPPSAFMIIKKHLGVV